MWVKYRIAELNLLMKTESRRVLRQAEAYRFDFEGAPDLTIDWPREDLARIHAENPHLTIDDVEYIETGFSFYANLAKFDGFLLHSSAIRYQGRSLLFSGPSGVGKSTHARGWARLFGDDQVQIINDDKPAVRLMDGTFYVYGTPWTGKERESLNVKVPLGGILLLEQGRENRIERVRDPFGIYFLLNQTMRYRHSVPTGRLLSLIDRLFDQIPIFKMTCALGPDGVRLSHAALTACGGPDVETADRTLHVETADKGPADGKERGGSE